MVLELPPCGGALVIHRGVGGRWFSEPLTSESRLQSWGWGFQVCGAMTKRARCVECRRWYHPAASAEGHQCVCGPECRKARRRKQAKLRRAADLQHCRQEERRRQRESRARRHEASCEPRARVGPEPRGRDVTGCHAPASGRNDSELLKKARRLWDKQVRLSRASLDRELGRMGLKIEEIVGEALGAGGT